MNTRNQDLLSTDNLTAHPTQAIAHLKAFIVALENYAPGVPGANASLQLAMRPLRMPHSINMSNALAWAQVAIEAEEKALAFELQKDAALASLKDAERQRRHAERLAQRARKALTLLLKAPSNTSSVMRSSRGMRSFNADIAL